MLIKNKKKKKLWKYQNKNKIGQFAETPKTKDICKLKQSLVNSDGTRFKCLKQSLFKCFSTKTNHQFEHKTTLVTNFGTSFSCTSAWASKRERFNGVSGIAQGISRRYLQFTYSQLYIYKFHHIRKSHTNLRKKILVVMPGSSLK